MTLVTVHAQLKDKVGNELDARDVTGHSTHITITAAKAWGRGALARTDDPDAYVVYSFTESKEKP